MAIDASPLLGTHQLAGAVVYLRGADHHQRAQPLTSTGPGSSGALASAFLKDNIDRQHVECAVPTTPAFGGPGFLALTTDDVVLLTIRQGLLTAKPSAVLAKVPRAHVAGATLGVGMTPVLSLLFDNGQAWSFDITRKATYYAKTFVEALPEPGQR
jgi:hypothetical protein